MAQSAVTAEITDRTAELLSALRDYAAVAREASLEGLVRLRIGETDLKAMRFLLGAPGSLARDLAKHLGISSASTTTLVDRLAERGLVRREPSKTDRRTINLYPTVAADEEPWSSLDRFDERAGAVAMEWPEETVAAAAEMIAAMADRSRSTRRA